MGAKVLNPYHTQAYFKGEGVLMAKNEWFCGTGGNRSIYKVSTLVY